MFYLNDMGVYTLLDQKIGILTISSEMECSIFYDSQFGCLHVQRNYRFYLTFVVSALVFFVYLSAFSCWKIHQRILRSGTGLMGLLRNCPETLALVLFGVAAIGFLGGLALFHVYLTAKNQVLLV